MGPPDPESLLVALGFGLNLDTYFLLILRRPQRRPGYGRSPSADSASITIASWFTLLTGLAAES